MGAKIVFCILLFLSTACATSERTDSDSENEIKYAVAYCLSSSYPDTEFSKDAGYISGAYLQKGRFGLDMYEEIRNFVISYRGKNYVSKHERNLSIMQCIDLFESKELDQIIENGSNE